MLEYMYAICLPFCHSYLCPFVQVCLRSAFIESSYSKIGGNASEE